MKNIKSLKYQLVLQFAIILLPMIAILLFQIVSDTYHSDGLARSYHRFRAFHGINHKYAQFINGAVDAVDTGELGMSALLALDDAAEDLRNLAREDHTGNFVKLQEKMDHIRAALMNNRSITALVPLRQFINQVDAELRNEYLRYEKENGRSIEANLAFAKIQNKIVFGAIVITFVLSVMVGRSITRSITRPISEAVGFVQSKVLGPVSELTHGSTRLTQKDLFNQRKVKATGEVQMLVDSINRMAEDLDKRTRDLLEAQEELIRKEKLATLGKLAGSVGHELRNPLGVMSNAVYFLKTVMTGAEDSVREYLDIIKHEIDNSERIISDLLDFARTRPPQTREVAARELVDQSLEKCTIPEGVALQVEVPETLPVVRVDPLQVSQVMQNLVTNGVQAMPEGGTLRIAARQIRNSEFGIRNEERQNDSAFDTDFIEISVNDTGAGISPENMRRLFHPLFTTKAKGIGLGLVVCKNLTESNGGRIRVESHEGKGTTFMVALPVGKDKPCEKM